MNIAEYKKSPVKQLEFALSEVSDFVYRGSQHVPVLKKATKRTHYGDRPILSVDDGRKLIRAAVTSEQIRGGGYMVGRFGTSEGRALFAYYQIQMGHISKIPKQHRKEMCVNAGFFPNSEEALFKWAQLLTTTCEMVDLLGVMHFKGEKWITKNLCPNAQLMPNGGIATGSGGWSDCLEGKKVLVIHPFTKSIEYQYRNHREELYPGTNKMPEFDLKLIKAVQTIADATDDRFKDWFEALDYMTEEAAKVDFDVGLIGCGAYGFPLAARIKQMGKVAIHMGGAVQNLFGIKSYRGTLNPAINKDYNDAWIYPDESEVPLGYKKVENGCYWK